MHAGHDVLMKVDDKILLIVSDTQGILDQLLRPHPICLLNIIIVLIYYNLIKGRKCVFKPT
jgi:hypothetical protein